MRDLKAVLCDYEEAIQFALDEGTDEANDWLEACRTELMEILKIALAWEQRGTDGNS